MKMVTRIISTSESEIPMAHSPPVHTQTTSCGDFGAVRFAILLFGLLAAPLLNAAAQDTIPLLVRAEDHPGPRQSLGVVRRDARLAVEKEIYRSSGIISGDVSVSPDGRFISLVEVVQQSGRPQTQLVVLDTSGRIARTITNRVFSKHVWSGPNRIAFIVGRPGEGGDAFRPESVSIVDVVTGAEQRLEGISRPYQLHWASFDSSLYLNVFPPQGARGRDAAPRVYRYDIQRGALSVTSHRGVFFSPDGLYYFDPSVEGSAFRLYRASDDQDVTARLQLPAERVRWGPEFGWMPGAGHVLLFVDRPAQPERQPGQPRQPARLMDRNAPRVNPDRWNLAVDAETGAIIERFEGDLGAGWKTNAPVLPIERRGGTELYRLKRR